MKARFCMLLFFVSINFLYAQDSFTLTGKVISATDGLPVIGANIIVVNASRGTTSDFDGNFSLSVSEKDVLTISYVGYVSENIIVTDQRSVTVSLREDTAQLDEVVVIAYGTQKKSSLTGAVASLENKNLDELPYSRVDQSLQGKIAGVQIQNVSSEVGTAPQINIRGLSSISANTSPLIVVDGFPIADALEFINPSTIKSIEVLKDASSTALYGSRGANGVILITTKNGSLQPRYVFKTFTGFKKAYEQIDVLDAYQYTDMLLRERQLVEDYNAAQNGTTPSVLTHSDREMAQRIIADRTGGTDWAAESQRGVAHIKNYQFDVSGGNSNTRYYISTQWIEDEGLLKDNFNNRFNLQGRLSTKLSDDLEIGVNFRPSYSRMRRSTVPFSDFSRALQWGPVRHNDFTAELTGQPLGSYAHPRHFNNTTYNYTDENGEERTFTVPSLWGSSNNNPMARMENEERMQYDYRMVADGFTNWNITDDLKYRGSVGFYFQYRDYELFRKSIANRTGQSLGLNTTYMRNRVITEHTLNYKKKLGDHRLDALLGTTYEYTGIKRTGISGTQFPTDLIETINAATVIDADDTYTNKEEIGLVSFLARMNYEYKGKYLASVAARYDGSSLFGPENKYGFFPSASVGWNLHKETFWKDNVRFINEFKIRSSFGMTGNNNIENYAFANLLYPANYSLGESGGSVTSGLGETYPTLGNRAISWEQTYQYDTGLDISFFKNKLTLTGDYYYSITDKLLLQQNVSFITGRDNYWNNVGKIQNQGFELALAANLGSDNFSWNGNVNFSANRNKLISLGGEEQFINQGERNEQYISRVGEEAIQFYGYKMTGIWQNAEELATLPSSSEDAVGGIRVADINGDGVITAEDRTTLGSPFPDFTWGFSNTFTFKGFDLYFLLQGSHGAEVFYGDGFYTEPRYLHRNFVEGRWFNENFAATKPREKLGRDWILTDYLIQDASYISLREVILGYSLPQSVVNKIRLDKVRFFVSGQNLLYLMADDFFGINPEAMSTSGVYNSPLISGYQRGAFPVQRQITLGLDINF
ncbi:TonB-linked outer membrane protein, SusC/RagA family [Sinomicrobium oceani]|uniref:TonB-linked outer membrane protein, SusC/RagA family n=1 Tax=Sinomicrobium oceani TaxID=1150368 RepID=A0A1K1PVS9_9FLAO|nr:TonB-dependent receptor [Sinomicrobium oceani]SFW51613.1 TonB-linked outer membrane protein, SusC/RagA family [Sinomicrobium oceani]